MSKNNQVKWWVGAILFIGFLLTFFMDLTGLELHQWLGISVGILLIYHLLAHLDWVNAVAERLFGGTSNRARLYLLVDIIIACGFGFIIGTGLLMSTWFQIPLVNYDFWWSFHILFSIGTLIMVALKLLLHWRWIVTTFRKSRMVQRRNPVIPAPAQVAVNSSPIGRRQFLSVAGMIGIGTLVAASSALKSLKFIQDAQTNVYAQEPPAPTYESQPPQMIENTAPPISEPAPTSAATPTSVQATPTSAPVNCTVRCNHHCAYPGRCRKYVDLNNNNLCDYGECL